MLKQSPRTIVDDHLAVADDDGFVGHEVVSGDLSHGLLLICDHARNTLPPRYGDLGLPASEFTRHIAFDIGVEGVTRQVAASLGVPAIMTRYSRLLIDPNRGLDDPTLIMKLSDGAIVPGNAEITEAERQFRIDSYYQPYHNAVIDLIEQFHSAGIVPALLSIHSFTAHWKGVPRPWHAGILWDHGDNRFANPLIAGLAEDRRLVVGDNVPYSGGLSGDSMDKHGTRRGLAHALLEIRQDLVADQSGIDEWAGRLNDTLPKFMSSPELHSDPRPYGDD